MDINFATKVSKALCTNCIHELFYHLLCGSCNNKLCVVFTAGSHLHNPIILSIVVFGSSIACIYFLIVFVCILRRKIHAVQQTPCRTCSGKEQPATKNTIESQLQTEETCTHNVIEPLTGGTYQGTQPEIVIEQRGDENFNEGDSELIANKITERTNQGTQPEIIEQRGDENFNEGDSELIANKITERTNQGTQPEIIEQRGDKNFNEGDSELNANKTTGWTNQGAQPEIIEQTGDKKGDSETNSNKMIGRNLVLNRKVSKVRSCTDRDLNDQEPKSAKHSGILIQRSEQLYKLIYETERRRRSGKQPGINDNVQPGIKEARDGAEEQANCTCD